MKMPAAVLQLLFSPVIISQFQTLQASAVWLLLLDFPSWLDQALAMLLFAPGNSNSPAGYKSEEQQQSPVHSAATFIAFTMQLPKSLDQERLVALLLQASASVPTGKSSPAAVEAWCLGRYPEGVVSSQQPRGQLQPEAGPGVMSAVPRSHSEEVVGGGGRSPGGAFRVGLGEAGGSGRGGIGGEVAMGEGGQAESMCCLGREGEGVSVALENNWLVGVLLPLALLRDPGIFEVHGHFVLRAVGGWGEGRANRSLADVLLRQAAALDVLDEAATSCDGGRFGVLPQGFIEVVNLGVSRWVADGYGEQNSLDLAKRLAFIKGKCMAG